jgi:glycosyltransferase involved in cell wall biosynthesis
MQPTFSVIVPAFNEEKYLPGALDAIRKAEECLGEEVEIVVGDNVSTDGTVRVAEARGAKVVCVETRCISAVRNSAAAAASGRYLLFTDADNRIAPNMLIEVKKALDSGRYIGGGVVKARYDRSSVGIRLTQFIISLNLRLWRLSMFMFYTTPEAFNEVGGFSEKLYANEDMDFAIRLRWLGRKKHLQFCNLRTAELTLSSRKFDEFGDWVTFTHPVKFAKTLLNDREAARFFWYRPKR